MRLGVDTGVQENKCLRAGAAAQPRAFRWLAPGPRTVLCLEWEKRVFLALCSVLRTLFRMLREVIGSESKWLYLGVFLTLFSGFVHF